MLPYFYVMILQSLAELNYIPKRIVSLVPSQTELLYDLELDDTVIGITKFCIHPSDWRQRKTIVGGTKTVNIDKIISLQPDLIIANKEENIKEQVETLAEHFKVWVTDVSNLEDALQMIKDIGQITATSNNANSIVNAIIEDFSLLLQENDAINTAYLIWRKPYMTVGSDTFIHDMLHRCGLKNIFGDQLRYPAITIDDLKQRDCRLLLLSSEPYPFKQPHIDELQMHLPTTKIILADGEMFSWYGSRLLHAADYFKQLIQQIREV